MALIHVLRVYRKAQFIITTMYADNEFKVLRDYIEDKCNACLNCAAAEEHVPEAENNNKVIKMHLCRIPCATVQGITTQNDKVPCHRVS